jgi:hypothetical protein
MYTYTIPHEGQVCKKFQRSWAGPYDITAKISDLNYEIRGQKERNFIVHINSIKPAYNVVVEKPNLRTRQQRGERARKALLSSDSCEYPDAFTLGSLPLVTRLRVGMPVCLPRLLN